MHSTDKGDLTKAVIVADLLKRGLRVLLPYGENWRYDIGVEHNGRLIRIQAKTGILKSNVVQFRVCSVINNFSRLAVRRPYTAEEVDWFGIYCPQNERVFYVPIGVCGSSIFSIRLEPTRNGQMKGVNSAEHFVDITMPV